MATAKFRPFQRYWHFLDAEGIRVGNLSAYCSVILQGKHKPTFNNGIDVGDNVVVINASKMVFTGEKYHKKLYKWHTGWKGSLKSTTPWELSEKKGRPEDVLIKAVKGMLPKNYLRPKRVSRLHIFPGEDHNLDVDFTYTRQLPRTYDIRKYFK